MEPRRSDRRRSKRRSRSAGTATSPGTCNETAPAAGGPRADHETHATRSRQTHANHAVATGPRTASRRPPPRDAAVRRRRRVVRHAATRRRTQPLHRKERTQSRRSGASYASPKTRRTSCAHSSTLAASLASRRRRTAPPSPATWRIATARRGPSTSRWGGSPRRSASCDSGSPRWTLRSCPPARSWPVPEPKPTRSPWRGCRPKLGCRSDRTERPTRRPATSCGACKSSCRPR